MNTSRLSQFMARIATETYPEPISVMHSDLTRKAMDMVLAEVASNHPPLIDEVKAGLLVLDVGCGQGPALKLFKERGMHAMGIALNDEDVKACDEQGFDVCKMDQNDLQFEQGAFDLVWARHVLEHSIAPLWTLAEFHRVLKPGGVLYAEMPAPDTSCCHHMNKNHYSVLGRNAWLALMGKAGFGVQQAWTWQLKTGAGPDEYYGFICRKV